MAKDIDKSAAKQKAREEHIKRTSQNASSAKSATKAAEKKSNKSGKKPGFFARVKAYFAAVRTELRRVVWPSKKDLVNYSVAVIATLLIVGVLIAGLDTIIGEGLVLLAGLRG